MPYNICKSEEIFIAINDAILAINSLYMRVYYESINQHGNKEALERLNFVDSFHKSLVESHNKLIMSREYETSRPILLQLYESIDPMEDHWDSAGEAIYDLTDVLSKILFPEEYSYEDK